MSPLTLTTTCPAEPRARICSINNPLALRASATFTQPPSFSSSPRLRHHHRPPPLDFTQQHARIARYVASPPILRLRKTPYPPPSAWVQARHGWDVSQRVLAPGRETAWEWLGRAGREMMLFCVVGIAGFSYCAMQALVSWVLWTGLFALFD